MPHILCLRSLHPEALARLRNTPGFQVTVVDPPEEANYAEALRTAEAVIVRATRIDRAFLAKAPRLSLCCRHGVGYDAVDVAALTERGIPLTITPEANAVSVAEHTLMLMLATRRRLLEYDQATRYRDWGPKAALPTFDVAGQTLLIVGFGRIGGRVARLAAAFEMQILVYDPYVPANTIKGAGFRPVARLAEGLAQADVVSLHCPATAQTRQIANADFFAAMKPGAVFLNTARGSLVDEAALTAALTTGHLAAAGLDVLAEEPPRAPLPLFNLPNVVITPHAAAATEQCARRTGLACAETIIAHFAGRLDPDVVVNREVLRGNA